MEPPRRFDASQGPRIVGPRDGTTVDLGPVGARFMVWGEESGGGFSLVEHPIPPRHLAAPLHRHTREDEYSYVLEGRLGAQLGDDHCRVLEIISPAGFEQFFHDVAVGVAAADEQESRYGTQVDLDSVARLCRRHGLRFPGGGGRPPNR